jgi:hypothetical protein
MIYIALELSYTCAFCFSVSVYTSTDFDYAQSEVHYISQKRNASPSITSHGLVTNGPSLLGV